eukprot:Polyplicarium_translucidae@DN2750_c0_g1_i3.p1
MALAKRAPVIFWNLYVHFRDVRTGLKALVPHLVQKRPRRSVSLNAKRDQAVERRRRILDHCNCSEEDGDISSEGDEETREAMRREACESVLAQLREEATYRLELFESRPRRTDQPSPRQDGGRARRDRRQVLPAIPDLIVSTFLDEDGFPKRCLSNISADKRKCIYKFLCQNIQNAPIRIGVNEKGRAVFAAAPILKDDYVCEYRGEFLRYWGVARCREKWHEKRKAGSYMFYFENPYNLSHACIDATKELAEYGPARLVNHSHLRPNLAALAIPFNDDKAEPRLVFVAKQDIAPGTELLIDYGERDREALRNNPWLSNT